MSGISTNKPAIQRTLGILWDFHSDTFQITYLQRHHPTTKRGPLSELSSIVDPHGFFSPVVPIQRVTITRYSARNAFSAPLFFRHFS